MPNKDYGEISGLLKTLSKEVPDLVSGLMKSLYSPETAKNMGTAVGEFYKSLIDSGFPKEEALKMSQEYMISLKGVLGQK